MIASIAEVPQIVWALDRDERKKQKAKKENILQKNILHLILIQSYNKLIKVIHG